MRRNRFERVRRGLYRLPGFPRPEEDEMREKWMAVGAEKAVLSHQSALALLDLSDVIPDAVLLLGRRYRGLRRPPGVVTHTRPDEEERANRSSGRVIIRAELDDRPGEWGGATTWPGWAVRPPPIPAD